MMICSDIGFGPNESITEPRDLFLHVIPFSHEVDDDPWARLIHKLGVHPVQMRRRRIITPEHLAALWTPPNGIHLMACLLLMNCRRLIPSDSQAIATGPSTNRLNCSLLQTFGRWGTGGLRAGLSSTHSGRGKARH